MKSRMESASSWPEGPVVRLCQSMSMDITWRDALVKAKTETI